MRRVAALLAAVLAAGSLAACGGDGAEPGAPRGATLVLDFTPNAVHSGIYAALARGYYEQVGVELAVREPGESSDAPKLLEAGRADFAILDIHDLGIARERGFEVVAVAPIVQRPLASVIVRADGPVRRPRDLEGRSAGVTGLPSDDAVLESVVAGDGGDPGRVERVTIGFNAVASLAAGRVEGVTAFWNAEGVALRRSGVPTRVFRVERFGAPPYPELVLCASAETVRDQPALVRSVVEAGRRRPSTTSSRRSRASNLPTRRPSGGPSAARSRPPASTRSCCAAGPPGTSATASSVSRSTCGQPSRSRATSSGISRAIRDRGTTRSTPAASARSRVSASTCE